MLHGSTWMVGLRWSVRLAGIFSTAILARLLTPSDFGIVAIAMLFIGVIETLGDTGERLALIRQPSLDRSYYDTAFSLQFLIGVVTGTVLFLGAPLTVAYFHQPEAVPVIRLLALRAVISGAENIRTVDFRRDLRFSAFYALTMRARLFSLVITLVLAAWLQSYWALAIGILANQVAHTVLSYVMLPYRPGFSFARRRELFAFSGWTLLRSSGFYLGNQVDQFAVGGLGNAHTMGRYAVAMDVATSPTAEVNEPIVAVLYPVMSKCAGDRSEIRALFVRVFAWSAVVCAAASTGIMAIARDFCLLILGPQWLDAATLIPWLAIAAGLSSLGSAGDPVFDALGKPGNSARLQWGRLLLLMLGVGSAAWIWGSAEAVAIARLAVCAAFLPVMLFMIGRAIGISPFQYLVIIWRPVVAALVMGLALWASAGALPASLPLRLIIEVPSGAAIYFATILLLWHASKRPNGPETDATDLIRHLCNMLQRRWMR